MRFLPFLSFATAVGTSFVVYACATSDGGFNPGPSSAGGSDSTEPTAYGSAPSSNNGTKQGKGGATGVINMSVGQDPDAEVCAAADQPAEMTPVYMVFLYDTSGSMGDDPSTNRMNASSRWDPLKLGMIDFFQKSGTIGIQASLEYFPAPGDKTMTCHADYKTPAVAMTSLETPDRLINSLEAQKPKGGTPTLPAVVGGIAYARQLMTNDPGSKAVVVLVTDGEPAIYNSTSGEVETDCVPAGYDTNEWANTIGDISEVVDAAYRGEPSVQTYVIGIGEAQGDMSAIASSGGTEFIQLDATEPPETTRNKLTTKLQQIRTTQFECSMPLPKAVDFDQDKVNVEFKHTSGTVDMFRKSPGCPTKVGWEFDDENNPKKIFLCAETCSGIQQDLTGKLQLKLGCKSLML